MAHNDVGGKMSKIDDQFDIDVPDTLPEDIEIDPVEPPPIRENFLREQYLIFERAGYERGRTDMKREIGEKVLKIKSGYSDNGNCYTPFSKEMVLAVIEGVK